jgi:EPS-associated MarR family transcriptional regulator
LLNQILYKEYVELQVLDALSKNQTQTIISKDLSMAIGKINFIAQALVKKGFIKIGNFINEKDKTKYKYLLTEKGLEQKILVTKKFIKIKKAEYKRMQEELNKYESQ